MGSAIQCCEESTSPPPLLTKEGDSKGDQLYFLPMRMSEGPIIEVPQVFGHLNTRYTPTRKSRDFQFPGGPFVFSSGAVEYFKNFYSSGNE